jgi:RNA polymerase sigma-70 factor (ECF subfamily)
LIALEIGGLGKERRGSRSHPTASAESPGLATEPASDEATLVRRAVAGDLRAFEALYRRYADRIYVLCRRLCGDPALAEDGVQEAFVRAWKSLPEFQGRSRFSTWLHQIAVRVVLDEKRRERRQPKLESISREEVPPPEAAREAQDDLRVELERAIAGLPEGARQVLVLHDVYGYEHAEIATMGGFSEGNSRSQLHRARLLLRKALEP